MWEKESAARGHLRRRSRGLVQISGGKVVVDFSDREYRALRSKRSGAVSGRLAFMEAKRSCLVGLPERRGLDG